MQLSEMKQAKERTDDLEYGLQLAKNLGFSKIGAKKATKEPSGTIMDQIFASREHKAHAARRKVEQSSVYPQKNKINAMKEEE